MYGINVSMADLLDKIYGWLGEHRQRLEGLLK
jgi:hypothetical protein